MKMKPLTDKKGNVRELKADDIQAMRSASEALPPELVAILPKRKVGQRGAQKKPTKILLTLRYSQELVNYFKTTGKGWQVKIDDALKEWIRKQPRSATRT